MVIFMHLLSLVYEQCAEYILITPDRVHQRLTADSSRLRELIAIDEADDFAR